MRKKRIIIAYILFISGCEILNFCTAAGLGRGNTSIYNTGLDKVIAPITNDGGEDTSILHMGSKRIFGFGQSSQIAGIDGIIGSDQQITYYDDALTRILTIIQNVVNFTLGLIGVVAVIYLLIHGFMILTAGDDDNKTKKGLKGVKNAFIAIVGILLSWIIISFILWLINTFTS